MVNVSTVIESSLWVHGFCTIIVQNIYETLKSHEFSVNKYDRFIAKSSLDSKQCTTARYVDYNKVSHVDEEVNTNLIYKITQYFGELTVTREKHKFLGMDI